MCTSGIKHFVRHSWRSEEYTVSCTRHEEVGIAQLTQWTGYGLDNSGIIVRRPESTRFFSCRKFWTHQTLKSRSSGRNVPGIKLPERAEFDRNPLTRRIYVMHKWELHIHSPNMLSLYIQGQLHAFYFLLLH